MAQTESEQLDEKKRRALLKALQQHEINLEEEAKAKGSLLDYSEPDKTCKACEKCEECLLPVIEDITGVILKKDGSGFDWYIKWKLPKLEKKKGDLIEKRRKKGYIIQIVYLRVEGELKSEDSMQNLDGSIRYYYQEIPYEFHHFYEMWAIEDGFDAPKDVTNSTGITYHDHFFASIKDVRGYNVEKLNISIEAYAKFCPCILHPRDLGFFSPGEKYHAQPSGVLWSTIKGIKDSPCWDIEPFSHRSVKLVYQAGVGWIYKTVIPTNTKITLE